MFKKVRDFFKRVRDYLAEDNRRYREEDIIYNIENQLFDIKYYKKYMDEIKDALFYIYTNRSATDYRRAKVFLESVFPEETF